MNIKNCIDFFKGKQFGKLIVVDILPTKDKSKSNVCKCVCECGTECEVSLELLINNTIKSCGCNL